MSIHWARERRKQLTNSRAAGVALPLTNTLPGEMARRHNAAKGATSLTHTRLLPLSPSSPSSSPLPWHVVVNNVQLRRASFAARYTVFLLLPKSLRAGATAAFSNASEGSVMGSVDDGRPALSVLGVDATMKKLCTKPAIEKKRMRGI